MRHRRRSWKRFHNTLRIGGLEFALRRECLVRAVTRTRAVSHHNAEMVPRARSYPADIRTDIQVCVASVSLSGGGMPVACRCAVLKVNAGAQSVRINGAVQWR